jgi:two-component sensor histidine kinase
VDHRATAKDNPQGMQIRILESIARDSALDETLAEICRMAERIVPGCMAGVTVFDRAGKVFERCVMPSAPSYAAAIAGAGVGLPLVGTCAAAVYHCAPVSSSDASGDMRFDEAWRCTNARHGIERIQSRPAIAADGRALGSFFIGFTSSEPSAWPDDVVAVVAQLAGLAIGRHLVRERDRLRIGETQHRLKNLFASVLSIAAQTARGHAESAEFMKAFEGRVQTLAAAHDLLSQDESVELGLSAVQPGGHELGRRRQLCAKVTEIRQTEPWSSNPSSSRCCSWQRSCTPPGTPS